MPYWHASEKAWPKHFFWKLSSKPRTFTIYFSALVIASKLNPLSLTLTRIFFSCHICSINMSNFEPRPIFFYNLQHTCFGCNNARLWTQEHECEQGHVNLEESIFEYFLPCRHNMLRILSHKNILWQKIFCHVAYIHTSINTLMNKHVKTLSWLWCWIGVGNIELILAVENGRTLWFTFINFKASIVLKIQAYIK